MNGFNTELITKQIVAKVAEVLGADRALLQNPSVKARFPCCVIQPPLQKPRYFGAAWNLSVTAEVWANTPYEAMGRFDDVRVKLLDYNFQMTNNTPLFQDPVTEKWRFGGYFECRWNAISNTFDRTR